MSAARKRPATDENAVSPRLRSRSAPAEPIEQQIFMRGVELPGQAEHIDEADREVAKPEDRGDEADVTEEARRDENERGDEA